MWSTISYPVYLSAIKVVMPLKYQCKIAKNDKDCS